MVAAWENTALCAVTEYSLIEISHCEGHASGMKLYDQQCTS